MCMASISRQPTDAFTPNMKRPRDEDPHLLQNLSPEPSYKRPCSELSSSDANVSQWGFLDELYEFESSVDAGALESGTQEELLAEMMRSLEKVIESFDETSPSKPPLSSESSQCTLRPSPIEFSDGEETFTIAPSALIADLGLHSGFPTGSPCSPVSSIEELAQSVGDELPSLDVRHLDCEAGSSTSPSAAGVSPHGAGDWADASFGSLDLDPIRDFPRDEFDLVSLDNVF